MSLISEFFKSIFRVFGRVVAYIIIGAIIYFIGSNFVNASVQYRTLNGSGGVSSWTNWTTSTGSISNTGITPNINGKTIYQFRDNTAFASGKYYDLYMEFEYSSTNISTHSNIDIVNTIFIEVYNGTTLKSIASQCATNYVQTDTTGGSSGVYRATHKIVGTFTCNGISGTGYYPYIGFAVRSNYDDNNQVASSSLNIKNWSYTLNTKATETNDIINNNNNNTNSIINNNNYNTEQITGSIGDLNDSLTDTTPPSDYSFFNDIGLSSDTPISNLILMPITLLSAINSGFGGTCSQVNLGSLLGHDLVIPCIDIESRIGSNLWNTIDGLISIFLIYEICMMIVGAFEDMTSLNDSYTNLIARHSSENVSYTPRHGGS